MSAEPSEELGPKMLALDDRAQKFVLLIIHAGKNPTQAAKLAGYSDKTHGYLRVQGHRLMRQRAVIAALQEEAEKHLGGLQPLAIVRLGKNLLSKNGKISAAAVDSILDRTGISRKTTQDIRVEHVDNRSTGDLLASLRHLMPVRRSMRRE